MDTYKWLICWLCRETNEEISNLMKNGACKFTARNQVLVYRSRIIPRLYFEHLSLNNFFEKIQSRNINQNISTVLNRLGILYGLWSLEKYAILFYEGQYTSDPILIKLMNQSILKLCSELKNDIIGVADALAPPDFVVNSVLGKADGQVRFRLLLLNIF